LACWAKSGSAGVGIGEYPEKLSPAEGAAVWMQYLTAWGALVHYGR